MSDLTYNTGILKAAELITGIDGCVSFEGEDAQGFYHYNEVLNSIAGSEIPIVESDEENYDYKTIGAVEYGIRTEWLDYINVNVYWDQVPIDTEVEVSADNVNWFKRHFARYNEDSPDGKKYYVFESGKTSYTIGSIQEIMEIDCAGKSASDVFEKCFFLYSENNAYYVWFDVNNSGTDPNPVSPGGQPLTEIEVNLNTDDSDAVIASKLRYAIVLESDFSVTLKNNTIVEVTVNVPGMAYDLIDKNSGLSLTVTEQGGGEESFQYARLP